MQTLQTNAEDKSSWLQLLLHSQTSTEILLHYKIFVKTLSCIKSWAKCIKLQYKSQFVRIIENSGVSRYAPLLWNNIYKSFLL